MKKQLLAIVLASLVLISAAGCATNNPNEIQTTLNTSVDIPAGKTAVVKSEKLSVTFDSVIGDSRCPSDVVCIQAGDAKCKLLLTKDGKTTEEVIITQPGSSEGSKGGVLGVYQFTFQLNPYPKAASSTDPKDYILSLKISK